MHIHPRYAVSLVVLAVGSMLSMTATAQRLKYDNQEQLVGAALMSPISGEEVLRGIFARCASTSSRVLTKQDEAMKGWIQEHRPMIEENLRLRDEYMRETTDEGRKMLKSLIEVQGPQIIEAQVKRFTVMVDVAPDAESRAQLCFSIAESVVDGKWDIRVNDPPVFEFLQRRIAARR